MYVSFTIFCVCACMEACCTVCLLNNKDVMRGAQNVFAPLHAYVCESPACETIWSTLNGHVHYRAMTRETLVTD